MASKASNTILSNASGTGFDEQLVCQASTSVSDCFSSKVFAIGWALDQTELCQALDQFGHVTEYRKLR